MNIQQEAMIKNQLVARGVKDPKVLQAMVEVDRAQFVLPEQQEWAYVDSALPVECGQTISQPYIVGLMTQLANVQEGDKVLEIGTGTGYQTAILAHLANQVYSIETIESLYEKAKKRLLEEMQYKNIHLKHGDGFLGWPEYAPFNVILVTAATPKISPHWVKQLAVDGRLIAPIGPPRGVQSLCCFLKDKEGHLHQTEHGAVRFVPLVSSDF